MKKYTLLLACLLGVSTHYANAQGCSDAGFCTINSFKPNGTDSVTSLQNQFKIGTFAGKADHGITAYGSYVEYNKQLNANIGFDAKLTSLGQSGNQISTYGISDLFVNTHYKLGTKLNLTLGGKIPLSNANKTHQQKALPMDYQSSLGTFDLIFGIGYEIKNIQLVAAIQQPLTQNKNQFLANTFDAVSKLNTFQSTQNFYRYGDVLLRVSYPIQLTSKLKLTPSLLPIYHLQNDKYTDGSNTQRTIQGSQGLTLNSNIYFDYQFNAKSALQFNFGAPFVVRTARPDGLTRSYIANIEYQIRF